MFSVLYIGAGEKCAKIADLPIWNKQIGCNFMSFGLVLISFLKDQSHPLNTTRNSYPHHFRYNTPNEFLRKIRN